MKHLLFKACLGLSLAIGLGLGTMNAATITLRNGDVINGKIVKIDDDAISIEIKLGNTIETRKLKRSDIGSMDNFSSSELALLSAVGKSSGTTKTSTTDVNIDQASVAIIKTYRNQLKDAPAITSLFEDRTKAQQAVNDDPFDQQLQSNLQAINKKLNEKRLVAYARLAVGLNHLQAGRYKTAAALLIQAGQHPTARETANQFLKGTLNDLIIIAMRINKSNDLNLEDYGTGWLDYNARGFDLGRKIIRKDGERLVEKDAGSKGYAVVLKEYKGNALQAQLNGDDLQAIERTKKIALLLQAGAMNIYSDNAKKKFDAINIE